MDAFQMQTFVLSPFSLMVQLYVDNYMREDLKKTLAELEGDLSLPRIHTYDYIIVGGGTAGCVLAERISRYFTVLLLEAGGAPIPATYGSFLYDYEANPLINYIYPTVPQKRYASANNGISRVILGKALGGSGSTNRVVYNRGSPINYDNVANFTGDPSFKYGNMLKYFKRLENYRGWLINQSQYLDYGHSGNFVVEKSNDPLLPFWFSAGRELGYKIADPNAHQIVSFSTYDKASFNSIRSSSYSAFIRDIEGKRESLRVLKYSTAQKILIRNGAAYGVAYKRHGIPQIAHANREVILSAGAISSPMLLIKSGIGPGNVLRDAGIPVEKNIPAVGQNFQNHPQIIVYFDINNFKEFKRHVKYYPTTKEEFQKELEAYQRPQPFKEGFFTTPSGFQTIYVSSRAKAEGQGDYADVAIVVFSQRLNGGPPQLECHVLNHRPRSVGVIGFNATAYREGEREDLKLALVDPNYFSDESDITVLIEAVRFTIKILTATKSFSPFNISLVMPQGCKNIPQGTDEYWTCVIERDGVTGYHLASSARVGKDDDDGSVLFSNFSVKGIAKLRVVDASAIPLSTNSNLAAPVLGVAEKGADVILRHAWGLM